MKQNITNVDCINFLRQMRQTSEWRGASGRVWKTQDMSVSHMKNVVNMLYRFRDELYTYNLRNRLPLPEDAIDTDLAQQWFDNMPLIKALRARYDKPQDGVEAATAALVAALREELINSAPEVGSEIKDPETKDYGIAYDPKSVSTSTLVPDHTHHINVNFEAKYKVKNYYEARNEKVYTSDTLWLMHCEHVIGRYKAINKISDEELWYVITGEDLRVER